MKKLFILILPLCILSFESFSQTNNFIDPSGNTIGSRIRVPAGYQRETLPEESFGYFLRNFVLEPDGTKVYYYNGQEKKNPVYVAVLKADVGQRDLQQCADAVIRLRAEYLYHHQCYDEIRFNFTNGFQANYRKWAEGNRIRVKGNTVSWYQGASADYSYPVFRRYLDCIFSYAGTLSLSKELTPVAFQEIQTGDVLIQGGSPGHAVIVVDLAVNAQGQKVFLLAQSYMPAQSIHILKNPENPALSPWYEADNSTVVQTPEWTFTTKDLKRFNSQFLYKQVHPSL